MTSFVVYTAILGEYDDLPTISARDERIRYVCFTDSLTASHSFWEIVPVQSYFSDKKISNGFLKANSHLLFGVDVISLWIDGNQRDVTATVESLSALVQDSPLAVLPHIIRKTVAEEVKAVLALGLEDPSTAARWENDMAAAGFPDDQPLISTCWLLRDHRNRALRNANDTWWRLISSGIRRDQLTFNFALWENGITPTYVDVDWTIPNRMFRRIEHKNPSVRALSRISGGRALRPAELLSMPSMPKGYPSDVCYAPERFGGEELDVLRRLNDTVHKTSGDGRVEGNYCHFNNEPIREFTPPDPRRSWKREYLPRLPHGAGSGFQCGA